jgi:hypothetical protein
VSDSERWVVCDDATKTIVGGPYLWDGETEWTAPEIEANPDAGFTLKPEGDALAGGYSYPPPPPPPTQPWVLVDTSGAMQIVGGPWDWNGQDDPPVVAADGQQLMTESDALSQGYAYPSP